MLKYVDTLVSFQEVPDEITLCINISNCPCHCEGCHSTYLAEDIGKELTKEELTELINNNKGISCVSFMGGDFDPWHIAYLAMYVKETYPNLKVSWYSGRDRIHSYITAMYHKFDYIKIGPYIPKLGGLDSETTNQIMYKVDNGNLIDITYRFKHDSKSSV
jgi:anaerobic ribonucleoside-triphosphate reductase activating protein